MRHLLLTATLMTVLMSSAPAAQREEHYVLLAATRTSTLQNEINETAERGFRVVAASRTESSEEMVVMERTSETYRYRLLATTQTSTLQRELNEAAEAGYRAMPHAIGTKRTLSDVMRRSSTNQTASNTEGELLVLMEKGPRTVPGLSYRVLATRRTGTLEKEMGEIAEAGYTLIALVSRTEHIAIFERAR